MPQSTAEAGQLTTTVRTTTQGSGPHTGAPSAGSGAGGGGGIAGLGQSSGLSNALNGELATVPAAQRQARLADSTAEQLEMLVRQITSWATGLPDRLAGASWHVDGVTAAGDAIAAAAGSLPALSEQLRVLEHEVTAAERLGAEASGHGADGQAEAFRED